VWSALAIIVLLVMYAGVLEYSRPHVTGREFRLDEFVDLAETGRVVSAEVLDGDAFVIGRYERPDGTVGTYNLPYLKAANSRERLVDVLIDNRVPTEIHQQFGKSLVLPATLLIPALIIVVVFIYLILSYRHGTGLFSITSGARKIAPEDTRVTFADVAAQDAAVAELKEVSLFLSEPDRFAELGAQIPKGILLYGPPGCGKTLLARALAGEAGAAFYSISGSDFVELYVGVGAARVRDLFAKAREDAPAILFIDELDSIGRRRGARTTASHGSSDEQEQALNQILAEIDGFSAMDGVIVIGATNRPDILDPALLRPGRFDRSVGLSVPDEKGRLDILRIHAVGKRLDPGTDLAGVAARAVGLTGADLAGLMNEAALLAARNGRKSISQGELEHALQRILEAPERQRRLSMRNRDIGQRMLTEERITFADVAGIDDAVEELAEVKRFLSDPHLFEEMGARVPRGFLLVGPPGCGKTMLARAVAGETNAAFLSVAASEFTEVFVGEGAARVRDLFAQAKGSAPAIVFIDEIDAIGGRRGTVSFEGNRESEQTLNQILVELDGFGARAGVVVMAATNRPDILDPALLRPGRFDRQITIDPPDRDGRAAILMVHARGKALAPEVDLSRVASLTPGFTGADLANVVNEAALLAIRRGLSRVTMAEIEEGIERAMLGVSSRGRIMTPEERRIVAYHEAGHALVARSLPGADPPHKLTILPRGRAMGYVWHPSGGERYVRTRSEFIDQMAAALAGRVSEDLVIGEPAEGAGGDLESVTETARRMVCELGMSKALGTLKYVKDAGRAGAPFAYSEETARVIDVEAKKLVDEAYRKAQGILIAERDGLDRVARALLEHETLSAYDLEQVLLDRRPVARPS